MTATNDALFERALKVIPGGVHSPVRSFKGLSMSPIFFKKGKGAYLIDVNDTKYIDFCMSFGPLIFGHQDENIKEKLIKALENGWSYGACEPYSLKLAELMVEKIKFIDQVRFVNSGTEAVMTAIRLARGFTKKDKIIKFEGCYHGHTDSMLIKAGSGVAELSEASSNGVPKGIANDTIVVELNDMVAVEDTFKKFKNQIAAVIIEPLPANNGLLIQPESFLKFLRQITKENDTLLIFDEVISGFRVAFGGMSEKINIVPDIVTYGKIIGGGLPVGAIAAKKEIMEHLAPKGSVYQAGTLSANPLAMTAGIETLSNLTHDAYLQLENFSKQIVQVFTDWFKEFDNGKFKNFSVNSYSSLFWIAENPNISKAKEFPSNLINNFRPLFETLIKKGIYIAPSPYEVGFVSLAHDKNIITELKKKLYQ